MKFFNPNEGDLGRAKFSIEVNELPLTIKIASNILYQANKLIERNGHLLNYPIEVEGNNSKLINEIINHEEYNLPEGIFFYDVDGRKIFELRGNSGNIVSRMICYLVAK